MHIIWNGEVTGYIQWVHNESRGNATGEIGLAIRACGGCINSSKDRTTATCVSVTGGRWMSEELTVITLQRRQRGDGEVGRTLSWFVRQ